MANVYDYILMRGDILFKNDPVNELDVFAFSQIVMPDYKGILSSDSSGITISDTAKMYFKTHSTSRKNLGVLQSERLLPMFKEMGSSKRFGDLVLSGYHCRFREEKDEQFAALTVRISEKLICVVFRGTDDTITGWKEDFNLAVMDEVPSQKDASEYLKWAAENYRGKIIVAGHSKGGNLAVYAAARTLPRVRKRITAVYNFDGPGFRENFLNDPGYLKIKDRIITIRPQNSIIGLLLHTPGAYNIIVHTEIEGLAAHDGFNWEVKGPGFIRDKSLGSFSRMLDKAFNDTVEYMTEEEKNEFIDIFFKALKSTGAKTLSDLQTNNLGQILGILFDIGTNRKIRSFAKKLITALEKQKKVLTDNA